jgi:hypothetical protein
MKIAVLIALVLVLSYAAVVSGIKATAPLAPMPHGDGD